MTNFTRRGTQHVGRGLSVAIVVGAVLLVAVVLSSAPPVSSASTAPVTIATTTEAWYAPPPTCALATGCGPTEALPPDPRYPAGTLHVAVTNGLEQARTYVKLGLDALPDGRHVVSGELWLPVAGSDSGTSAPETATLVVCLAAAPFAPASGSMAPPPAVDCSTSAPATFDNASPPTFTVALDDFLAYWERGGANHGVAVLPAPGGSASWRVAFRARQSASGATPPVSAVVHMTARPESPTTDGSPDLAPSAAVGEPLPPIVVPDVLAVDDPDAAGLAIAVGATQVPGPEPAAEALGALPAVAGAPIVADGRFAYPLVFALPLVLLALGAALGWSLTHEPQPRPSSD